MKLILSNQELRKEFGKLTKEYNEFYWTVAWAGSLDSFPVEIKKKSAQIKKVIVGLHFYQTHPDFIEYFLNHKGVKFIKQTTGTFHPKVYLFMNSKNDWRLIMGSSNFTNMGFTQNTEANILLSSDDKDSEKILKQTLNLVESNWEEASYFDKEELIDYRKVWNNQRRKLKSLSGRYGSRTKPKKTEKAGYLSKVINMDWKEFVKRIEKEKYHGLERRIAVLELSKELFDSVEYFNELEEDERKFIAGIPNKLDREAAEDWGYFGSMKGAGIFKNKIRINDKNISLALNEIPSEGQITKKHYNNFIKYFTNVFEGNYLATASRLLAMKRPDTFYCLTSKNQKRLCKEFDIIYSHLDYEGYWEQIIERIFDSEWWRNPKPKNKKEKKIMNSRAAFLDAFYYER